MRASRQRRIGARRIYHRRLHAGGGGGEDGGGPGAGGQLLRRHFQHAAHVATDIRPLDKDVILFWIHILNYSPQTTNIEIIQYRNKCSAHTNYLN